MIDYTFDADAWASSIEETANELPRAEDAMLDDVARLAAGTKRDVQHEGTYARPIPQSSTGRLKWTRSGNWQAGVVILRGPHMRTITQTGPSTEYDARLSDLPTGRDGINRANPAADRTYDRIIDNAYIVAESAFYRVLRI